MSRLLEELIELLDIPPSYYEKAADRYRSLGEWLHRENSSVVHLSPAVYPQGSFRYGTVIRPLDKSEEYDLDLVCELAVTKDSLTQKRLKHMVGAEIQSYAEAHNFNSRAEEKKRCWRLNYADHVSFHMDILPAAPDDAPFKSLLIGAGVPKEFAAHAIAITDTRHANYDVIDMDWPRSNPKGFARWFEQRMAEVSLARRERLVENRAYASVDEVPPYAWKTPLQRAIQLLKRHRDVMFRRSPEQKPISMIITTLAARAYGGETDVYAALTRILDEMPSLVRDTQPRVPNPVNPAEDFADKWKDEPQLEWNFRRWHRQSKADFANLNAVAAQDLRNLIRKSLDLEYSTPAGSGGIAAAAVPAVHIKPSSVNITAPPSPWAP